MWHYVIHVAWGPRVASDEHVSCSRTLTSHLHDGCLKNGLAYKLFNPNQQIENVTNHMKSNCLRTIVEVSNLILCDYGKTIFLHIWKHLEMLMLILLDGFKYIM